MVNTPHTYSEWSQLLNMLKNQSDDQAVLAAMQGGTIEWQSGIADRFSKKITDAVNTRLNKASDRFQMIMGHSGGDGAVIQAMDFLRKEYYFLCRAVDIPCIPQDIRKQYIELIIDQANKTQDSLEDSARRDRSGRLAFLVKQHRVNDF